MCYGTAIRRLIDRQDSSEIDEGPLGFTCFDAHYLSECLEGGNDDCYYVVFEPLCMDIDHVNERRRDVVVLQGFWNDELALGRLKGLIAASNNLDFHIMARRVGVYDL